MVFRVVACALLIGATSRARAQEAFNNVLLPSNHGSLTISRTGQPTIEIPTYQGEPTVEIPTYQDKPTVEIPTYQGKPIVEIPTYQGKPTVEIPTYQGKPTVEIPTYQDKPTVEIPTYQGKPTVEIPTYQGKPIVDVPSNQGKPIVEMPSNQSKPIVEMPSNQSKPIVETPTYQSKPTVEVRSRLGEALLESAWLDLRQNAPGFATTQSAPRWVEAVTMVPAQATNGGMPKSVFRIRVTQPSGDYQVLFFRLFFDDKPEQRPELIAWDESGTQVLRSGELGSGIDLPSSDVRIIPMAGVSSIDIEVPGDGKTVRGAYLDWMTSSEVVHPLSAEHRDAIPEAFSAMPPLHSPTQDTEQFGTVTATLAAETIRIGPSIQEAAVFQFGIEAQPLLALLTFEVANPRIDAPPEIYVNSQDIGPVSLVWSDLADPGYRGQMETLLRQMHFQYTGWLRAQKIVPVADLKVGTNDVIVLNGAGSAASAIRATQIQLKYLWDKSDYILQTRGH